MGPWSDRIRCSSPCGLLPGSVQARDAPHFVHRERMALHGVPGPDHQLGLHALDVRARILDDAIVAILDRPRPLGVEERDLGERKSALTPRRPLTAAAWRSPSAASG